MLTMMRRLTFSTRTATGGLSILNRALRTQHLTRIDRLTRCLPVVAFTSGAILSFARETEQPAGMMESPIDLQFPLPNGSGPPRPISMYQCQRLPWRFSRQSTLVPLHSRGVTASTTRAHGLSLATQYHRTISLISIIIIRRLCTHRFLLSQSLTVVELQSALKSQAVCAPPSAR